MRLQTPDSQPHTAQDAQNTTTEKLVTVTVPAFYEYVVMYKDNTTKIHTETERIAVAKVRKDMKKSDENIADVFFRGQQTKKIDIPLSVLRQYMNINK